MSAARALVAAALLLACGAPAPAAAEGPAVCARDADWGLVACLETPTGRYGHNVLGAFGEWAELTLRFEPGLGSGTGKGAQALENARLALPEDRVFEDVAPRLADIVPGGRPEIVVVESSRAAGAALAVYGFRGGRLERLAAAEPIGRPFRWLAPAGIADLDGDGVLEIAYVETPHIGGRLRVMGLRDGALAEIASAPGFSNHRIGEDFITGGVRDCGAGPELVLPDFRWSETRVVRLEAGALVAETLAGNAEAATLAGALACR